MPIFNDATMQQLALPSGQYSFSATRLDDLGATEYTLVTIVCDASPSVSGFVKEMENALVEIVKACKFSPRADNLMVRLVLFATSLTEVHGFKLLEQCNPNDYKHIIRTSGGTALYDAAENAISALTTYGKQLTEADFATNGIVFVLTDGEDNASTLSVRNVRDGLQSAVLNESLESLVSILIGVNVQDARIGAYLQDFKNEAGFTQYVEIDKADAKALARLADFVSRSISAQSKALGSGGSSTILTF